MSAPTPSLVPAYIFTGKIAPGLDLGPCNTGGSDLYVQILSSTFATVPGYSGPQLTGGSCLAGGDWIHRDPDGKHLRLDVRGVHKLPSGSPVSYSYTGRIAVDDEILGVLGGKVKDTATKWGQILAAFKFQTGEELRGLQDGVFVASGRFVVEKGEVSVEYHIFEVKAN